MPETKFKHECPPEYAQRFWNWITTRGGIAIWKSINLSNPEGSWSTPATKRFGDTGRGDSNYRQSSIDAEKLVPYPKPNWQCANEPVIVTDAKDVGVYTSALYSAFKVSFRRTQFALKLTDASQRKVDKKLDTCKEKHGNSFYRKGVLPDVNASIGIYYTTGIIPLDEWITKNGVGKPEDWEYLFVSNEEKIVDNKQTIA